MSCGYYPIEFFNLLPASYSGLAYHYTSPNGLLGILDDKKITLWFTHYKAMNDISEGQEYERLFDRLVMEVARENQVDEALVRVAKEALPSNFINHVLTAEKNLMEWVEVDYYLFCMSIDSDSLPMWNYYVKDGRYEGYCLGLNTRNITDSSMPGVLLRCHKVLYIDEHAHIVNLFQEGPNAETRLKERIRDRFELYQNIGHSPDIDNDISWDFGMLKQEMMLIVKNACFSHEHEVRLILCVPKDSSDYEEGDMRRFKRKYRSTAGYIVPYVELELICNGGANDALETIGIGPLLHDEMAERNLKMLLKDKGMEQVRIRPSGIPVRY